MADSRLPLALEHMPRIKESIGARRPGFFLDFDGTLTPVAPKPDMVKLSPEVREVLSLVGRRHLLCFLSGRGLEDLQRKIGLPSAAYAADHGHRIVGPPGSGIDHQVGGEYAENLEAAGKDLRHWLRDTRGAVVEVKGLSVSVHYRLVPPTERTSVQRAVAEVARKYPGLRLAAGKEVSELMPPGTWGKGPAMLWLIHRMGFTREDLCPVCVGDDLTDEGMFAAAEGWGVTVIVGDPGRATRASYRLRDSGETALFLKAVANVDD